MTDAYVNIAGDLMDANLQPPQHELQGAFKRSGARIVVDMDIAKHIARGMLRQARTKAFEANDVATMRAVQTGDTKALADASARAEALRNLTTDPRIAAAQTPDELLDVVDAIKAEIA